MAGKCSVLFYLSPLLKSTEKQKKKSLSNVKANLQQSRSAVVEVEIYVTNPQLQGKLSTNRITIDIANFPDERSPVHTIRTVEYSLGGHEITPSSCLLQNEVWNKSATGYPLEIKLRLGRISLVHYINLSTH